MYEYEDGLCSAATIQFLSSTYIFPIFTSNAFLKAQVSLQNFSKYIFLNRYTTDKNFSTFYAKKVLRIRIK